MQEIKHICDAKCRDNDCTLCPHGVPYGSDKCEWASCMPYCKHGKHEEDWCVPCRESAREADEVQRDLERAQGWGGY